jgi:lipopolysaccharide transport system ATP-binding protein
MSDLDPFASPPVINSPPVIKVQDLGKRYRIGAIPGAGGMYDSIGRLFGRRPANGVDAQTLWALRNLSFEVPRGQVVGVLGRNGSGKTTLMKILARVTAPTEGCATVHGRVGALLQVGIGFHPELSGRDNIALSGAILGTSRAEVAAKQDEIVEFSEIGRFLDTPVKHYSSGMFMRLAFSVSAHLTSEVMLVDEVLSVGDAAFRKKCENRIRQVVSEGRTVMFVSHDTDSVRDLCHSAMVLHEGQLRFIGGTDEAADFYEKEILKLAPDPPRMV